MTPEERFTRIEANLERLEERTDALTVQAEKSQHDFDLKSLSVNFPRERMWRQCRR